MVKIIIFCKFQLVQDLVSPSTVAQSWTRKKFLVFCAIWPWTALSYRFGYPKGKRPKFGNFGGMLLFGLEKWHWCWYTNPAWVAPPATSESVTTHWCWFWNVRKISHPPLLQLLEMSSRYPLSISSSSPTSANRSPWATSVPSGTRVWVKTTPSAKTRMNRQFQSFWWWLLLSP